MANNSPIPTDFFEVIKNLTPASYKDELDGWISASTPSADNTKFVDMFPNNELIFKQYGSFEEAFNVIEEARKVQNPPYWLSTALSYVDGVEYDTLKSTVDYMNLPNPAFEDAKKIANSVVGNVKELINLGGSFAHDRIIITEDKKGIFDFSLASKGLYRPIEFYSQEYKKAVDKGGENIYKHLGEPLGVVPNIKVDNVIDADGNKTFFVVVGSKKYNCERRQKGSTLVLNTYPNECILKQNKQGIFITYNAKNQDKVFNGRGKVMLKYASSNKKSYLIYEKKPESTKYVDIFVSINYIRSNGNLILNLITPILISASLEQFGIQTRISAVRNGMDADVFSAISIPVKTYEETTLSKIDFIFNMLGRTETISTLISFFKVYVNNIGEQKNKNGSKIVSGSTSTGYRKIRYAYKIYIDSLFSRYKNWLEINKGKPWVNTKVVNNNFQIFTIQASEIDVNFYPDIGESKLNTKVIVDNMSHAFFMFYYYMDFLSLEFNTMENLVKNIMVRLEEDENFRKIFDIPKSRKEKKSIISKYISNIIQSKYSYTTRGAYHDTKEQIKEKQEKFSDKFQQMADTLSKM